MTILILLRHYLTKYTIVNIAHMHISLAYLLTTHRSKSCTSNILQAHEYVNILNFFETNKSCSTVLKC